MTVVESDQKAPFSIGKSATPFPGLLHFTLDHHHHHVVPLARISLTLSRHFSLSFIASGSSSGPHPVSSHSCWMYVRAGRPAFAQPYVRVHRSTLDTYLILLSVKQEGIKNHFKNIWYDATWDWTQVSRIFGKHSTPLANELVMISIATAIQIQADTVVSGTKAFINFWLRFFEARKETQFLKVYANHTTWLHPHARCILWCLRSQSLEICKTWPHASMAETQRSNLNWHFFKIFKFSGPFSPGMSSSTLQPHFLSDGLLL